jgi:hypothetical protein
MGLFWAERGVPESTNSSTLQSKKLQLRTPARERGRTAGADDSFGRDSEVGNGAGHEAARWKLV